MMYDAQYRFTYRDQCRISTKLLDSYLQENYLFHVEHNSAELLRNVNSDVAFFSSCVRYASINYGNICMFSFSNIFIIYGCFNYYWGIYIAWNFRHRIYENFSDKIEGYGIKVSL